MKTTLLVLLAAHCLIAMPCFAQDTTAGDALRGCGASVKSMDGAEISPEEMFLSTWCVGYVSGMLDAARLVPDINNSSRLICPPASGITNEQAVRVVVKYLRAKPETLHESARIHVLIALAKAFPCGK